MLGTLEADSLMKFAYVMRQCLRNLRALLGADMQCLKLRDASAYLANFDSKMAEIDVFSSTVCPKVPFIVVKKKQFHKVLLPFRSPSIAHASRGSCPCIGEWSAIAACAAYCLFVR